MQESCSVYISQNFRQDVSIIQIINTNNIKPKVYKKLPREICEKCDGAEDCINDRIGEICSQEKLSSEEMICFSC